MGYLLKITPEGLSVRTADGLRGLASVDQVVEASFTPDGGAIRASFRDGATRILEFHAFQLLDGLDEAARVFDLARSIETRVFSKGAGLHVKLRYLTRQGRKHPVSGPELLELMKLYGPPPVWVAEISELEALAERLGPPWPDRPELQGPRFELSRLDGEWTLQWWPRGGGMESRPALRDLLSLIP